MNITEIERRLWPAAGNLRTEYSTPVLEPVDGTKQTFEGAVA
ncbi:hypothetical protein [Deinococcus detaillensis]|nr:hypothetical protein [Deinococcus detaillensis]